MSATFRSFLHQRYFVNIQSKTSPLSLTHLSSLSFLIGWDITILSHIYMRVYKSIFQSALHGSPFFCHYVFILRLNTVYSTNIIFSIFIRSEDIKYCFLIRSSTTTFQLGPLYSPPSSTSLRPSWTCEDDPWRAYRPSVHPSTKRTCISSLQ